MTHTTYTQVELGLQNANRTTVRLVEHMASDLWNIIQSENIKNPQPVIDAFYSLMGVIEQNID